jgi:ABC-2 type transport system permease protein
MQRYVQLYGAFFRQRLKVMLEYRVNFLIGMASTVFVQGASLTAIWVVMRQIPSLNGWTFDEILLVYGLITLSSSINHMFADNLWTLGRVYIRPGGFDRFLVRPIDPLFHLLADRFCQDGIGSFLVGAVLVIKAMTALHIGWSLLTVLYLVVAVLSGGVIFIALNLFTATASFWIVDAIPITLAVHQTHQFARYPLSIYKRTIGTLMTWVIPYGFASFYPASYLLGRHVGIMAWLSPVVAVLLLALAYRFWQFGLRHYEGTGS